MTNDTEYDFELGQRRAGVSLDSRSHHHRDAGVRLVDEPHSGAAGSLLLPFDPRRYRLSPARSDRASPDPAPDQSPAGSAGGYARVATDRSRYQPQFTLSGHVRRDRARLGPFRGATAG